MEGNEVKAGRIIEKRIIEKNYGDYTLWIYFEHAAHNAGWTWSVKKPKSKRWLKKALKWFDTPELAEADFVGGYLEMN